MVLVFDLDDTLYDEITYVESGFRAVAKYLFEEKGLSYDDSLNFMLQKLVDGRGRIFDELLQKHRLNTKKNIDKCVRLYRHHRPEIALRPDANRCLHRLANYPVYVVTDGHKIVQFNKIKALKLEDRVKFCFRTYQYGVKYSKPSPHCFLQICKREKVSPDQVVYIGDNPNKDFVGIKPLGFRTVRLVNGAYASIIKPSEYEADHQIHSLDELTADFLQKVFG